MKPTPEDIIQAVFDAAANGLRVEVVNGGGEASEVGLTPEALSGIGSVLDARALATEAGLQALAVVMTSGVPEQYVGTVGVSAIAVAFSGPTKHVRVSNPSKNVTIEVSYDGGASFVKVLSEQSLSLPCRVSQIHVRSGGGSQPYEVVATV